MRSPGVAPTLSNQAVPAILPWASLLPCVIAIMAAANLQYTWTLFVAPLMKGLGAKLSAVQLGFTLYIIAQTWLAPFEGWLADRFSPRLLAGAGGALVAMNWIGAGVAGAVGPLYVVCLLGGFGCGLVMATGGRIALRCFGERRGLAIGIVSMAYGLGPVLAVEPIQYAIAAYGYRQAFIVCGAVQAAVLLGAAWCLAEPAVPLKQSAAAAPETVAASNQSPGEMLRSPLFLLLYAIMTLVAFGGLLVTAQLAPIAASYGVPRSLTLCGIGAVTLAIMLDRVMNTGARPFWGWLSDHIGRPRAMGAAFGFEALAVLFLIQSAGRPALFVVLSGLTFFGWGEIFSLFPAVIADVFGPDSAMTNYGILFTAKGVASIAAGWGAARLFEAGGSWRGILWIVLACDALAAALTFLLPRQREG